MVSLVVLGFFFLTKKLIQMKRIILLLDLSSYYIPEETENKTLSCLDQEMSTFTKET